MIEVINTINISDDEKLSIDKRVEEAWGKNTPLNKKHDHQQENLYDWLWDIKTDLKFLTSEVQTFSDKLSELESRLKGDLKKKVLERRN